MSISRTRQLCFPAAALLALAASQALAADITVDAGGNCTLAEAIDSANNGTAAGNGCVDGSGADTIILETSVTLSGTPLPIITSTITIDGNTWNSINGNGGDFSVLTVSAAGNLTLKSITVTGANKLTTNGGGIHNSGTVNVTNAAYIQSNKASRGGGIYNDGGIVIVDGSSYIGSNTAYDTGGGIYSINGGTVTVKNSSSISSNSASAGGGGIYSNGGTVTVDKSTISYNTAGNTGAGLYINGGTLTLTDSTVAFNTESGNVGGGLAAAASVVTVSRSTFNNPSCDLSLLKKSCFHACVIFCCLA